MHRLFEQKLTAPERAVELDDYLRCWLRWATVGLTGVSVGLTFPAAEAKASQAQAEQ